MTALEELAEFEDYVESYRSHLLANMGRNAWLDIADRLRAIESRLARLPPEPDEVILLPYRTTTAVEIEVKA